MNPVTVAITVVTFNSVRFIARCLEHVFKQDYPLIKDIIVIDNASTDGTRQILHGFSDRIHYVQNDKNTGFAAAQNQAIGLSVSEWVLVLNPDVVLKPDFISKALEYSTRHDRIGS